VPKSPNPIPPVTIPIHHDLVFAVWTGFAVFSGEKVCEAFGFLVAGMESDAFRSFVEVMDDDQRIVTPLVADGEDGGVAGFQDFVLAPADFWTFFAETDHTFGPVQHGLGVSLLGLDVHALEAVWTCADDGERRFFRGGKSALRFLAPLHWRADRITLRKAEIIAHSNFISIAEYRRSGEREHQAVGHSQLCAVAQHRRKPPSNPTFIELHVFVGAEPVVHRLALCFSEAAKVKLIVIS
jgi:hypothetical protein